MTTTNASLALARAVYPDAWRDESALKVYARHEHGLIELFNPRTNADQLVNVLAWLLAQKPKHYYDGGTRDSWFEVVGSGVYQTLFADGEHVSVWGRTSNGTRQSLIDAVVTAAEKVAAHD